MSMSVVRDNNSTPSNGGPRGPPATGGAKSGVTTRAVRTGAGPRGGWQVSGAVGNHVAGQGGSLCVMECALGAVTGNNALPAFRAAREARPAPLVPRITRAGDDSVVIVATDYLDGHTSAAAPLRDVAWCTVQTAGTVPVFQATGDATYSVELRPDMLKPGATRIEEAGAISRLFPAPGNQRAAQHRAILRALEPGSSMGWMAKVSAACCDLAFAEAGVYTAANADARGFWGRAPGPGADLVAVAADDWQALALLGRPRQAILRAASAADFGPAMIAAVLLQGPADAGPVFRQAAWPVVDSVVVVLPAGTTGVEAQHYAAAGWRALIPPADAWSSPLLGAAIRGYAASFGLGIELQAAADFVCSSLLTVAEAGPAADALIGGHLPVAQGTTAVLGQLVTPRGQGGLADPAMSVDWPEVALDWVSGSVLATVATHAAAFALARDAGADPLGFDVVRDAPEQLRAAASGCAGEAALLARAVERAYGIRKPGNRSIGPADWCRTFAPDVGAAPASRQAETLALRTFGVGAWADVGADRMGAAEPFAATLPGVGDVVVVPFDCQAAEVLCAPELADACALPGWRRMQVFRAARGMGAAPGQAVSGLFPVPAAQQAAARAAASDPLPVPACAGVVRGYTAGAPASYFRVAGIYEAFAVLPVANAGAAQIVAKGLCSDRWACNLRAASLHLGVGEMPAVPPAVLAAPPAHRDNVVARAFAAARIPPALDYDVLSGLRDVNVPAPAFGEPGPAQPPPPAGPGGHPAGHPGVPMPADAAQVVEDAPAAGAAGAPLPGPPAGPGAAPAGGAAPLAP